MTLPPGRGKMVVVWRRLKDPWEDLRSASTSADSGNYRWLLAQHEREQRQQQLVVSATESSGAELLDALRSAHRDKREAAGDELRRRGWPSTAQRRAYLTLCAPGEHWRFNLGPTGGLRVHRTVFESAVSEGEAGITAAIEALEHRDSAVVGLALRGIATRPAVRCAGPVADVVTRGNLPLLTRCEAGRTLVAVTAVMKPDAALAALSAAIWSSSDDDDTSPREAVLAGVDAAWGPAAVALLLDVARSSGSASRAQAFKRLAGQPPDEAVRLAIEVLDRNPSSRPRSGTGEWGNVVPRSRYCVELGRRLPCAV